MVFCPRYCVGLDFLKDLGRAVPRQFLYAADLVLTIEKAFQPDKLKLAEIFHAKVWVKSAFSADKSREATSDWRVWAANRVLSLLSPSATLMDEFLEMFR